MKILEDPPLEVKRKLPWYIDALLYPISIAGIIHLLVFVFLPLLLSSFITLMISFLPKISQYAAGYAMGFMYLVFYVFFGGYVCYYFADCVIDSSKGGFRAHDINMQSIAIDRDDLIAQILLLLGCVAICFSPAAVYYIFMERTDLTFWIL